MRDFINRGKYRMCISSVQQTNENSIEFSLSTQTRRAIKSSQAKSLQGWNAIDNLLSIPNILFNSLINPATNWGPLSDMILSGRPCNFHTLSLNSLAKPSTDVFSIVGIKCTIFVNQSTTTRIES